MYPKTLHVKLFTEHNLQSLTNRYKECHMDEKELKKELARLKRLAVEIAGEIHDIVEDTLWVKYTELPILSAKIVEAIKTAETFKEKHNL